MYDEMTCGNCGFNPKEQNGGYDENNTFKSHHWKINYQMEFFPSDNEVKSWEEVSCPICEKKVHSTL